VNLREIERVAAAVLYEGYLLYPYRPSVKNVRRWTFGGVAPGHRMETEVLVEGDGRASVQARVRFLQVKERALEVPGAAPIPWQEGVEREVTSDPFPVAALIERSRRRTFRFPDDLSGSVECSAEPAGEGLFRVLLKLLNETAIEDPSDAARVERRSFMSSHAILTTYGGRFVSLTDPPPDKADAARACRHTGWWPVVIGDPATADAMLCSPIILPDYPRLAEESPGDLFDATEIDEILSLRIRTLTQDEKRTVAAADPRARALLERTEALAQRELEALHGAWRRLPETPHDAR